MKSLSRLLAQNFLNDKTDQLVDLSGPGQVPCVLVFRNNWHKVTPELTKVALAHNPNFKFRVAENWAELGAGYSLNPALIVFHMDMAKENGITLVEFVSMLHTMCKMIPGRDLKIAVGVEKTCTAAQFREIKNSGVHGIVPTIASYGVEKSTAAILELLSGKQHWPRGVIDSILNVKKLPKFPQSEIRLTVRQQQVMDLVCHRGLPNKTIANMLRISESTVKIHVSAILKEYGVRNRTQLALAARNALHD
jgi:DNA-binding NarL/FixJ family response regulator